VSREKQKARSKALKAKGAKFKDKVHKEKREQMPAGMLAFK
jgi:hypothetical protein